MNNLNDFFNKELLMKRIRCCEGLTDIEEYDNHIEAYDEEEDIFLSFHYKIDYNNLFDFGSLQVDKKQFFDILDECLEKILFLMPNKIYFISNEKELDKLTEEYDTQSMDFNNTLGINWLCDSVIVINVYQCRIVAKEIAYKTNTPFINTFNEALWTTLIHELRHMMCDLGIIIPEELVPVSEGAEEKVEEYGNECFWNSIYYKNYHCFS